MNFNKKELKCSSNTENPAFLTEQIITYIGNKRGLLDYLIKEFEAIHKKKQRKLIMLDLFSGSGIVARSMKKFSSKVIANDLEEYSYVINSCYLSNKDEFKEDKYLKYKKKLLEILDNNTVLDGIIRKTYSPTNDNKIEKTDRAFYTNDNAIRIDTIRTFINTLPQSMKKYFLAELLYEASVHTNTSGVFKGFYKNSQTKCGQFGGNGQNALKRILGQIEVQKPVLSNYFCDYKIYKSNANTLINELEHVDIAYLDPPYNQHPYGSNYFMLNTICKNEISKEISRVSGIPKEWNKSNYNKKTTALIDFSELVTNINAEYVIISYNSEGFISLDDMKQLCKKNGKYKIIEIPYNTFRGCKNLNMRNIHVTEYLFIIHKGE